MKTKLEIEQEIKKCKFKISDMPEYIISLIEEELEDFGDSQFKCGKEDGIAEENERWLDEIEEQKHFEKLTIQQVDFALSILYGIDHFSARDKIRELELEKCRLM